MICHVNYFTSYYIINNIAYYSTIISPTVLLQKQSWREGFFFFFCCKRENERKEVGKKATCHLFKLPHVTVRMKVENALLFIIYVIDIY